MSTDFMTSLDAEEHMIISEEEFGSLFGPFAQPILSLAQYSDQSAESAPRKLLNMDFLANVIKHSSDVEHLLDRYRARNNRNWVFFRELAATAKNIGKATFLLEELKKNSNPEKLFPQEASEFEQRGEKVGLFLAGVIARNFVVLQEEARRLDLETPEQGGFSTFGVKLRNAIILPHTIEESSSTDKTHTVKKLLHRFVEFADDALTLNAVLESHSQELHARIPDSINEGRLRRLGTGLHNFQSWYDSYVENTRIQGEFPALRGLREIFRAQLNLFKIATILAHYYERHLLIPSAPVAEKLQSIVSGPQLVEEALSFTLHYLIRLFESSKVLAESVLNALVQIVTYELPVPKRLGFHARPSTRVARVVQHHGAHVKMLVDDQVFNASSVLEMLSGGGYTLTKGLDRVQFRGDKRALDDLKILAEYNYGETREGKDVPLPETLSYLY